MKNNGVWAACNLQIRVSLRKPDVGDREEEGYGHGIRVGPGTIIIFLLGVRNGRD